MRCEILAIFFEKLIVTILLVTNIAAMIERPLIL